MAGTAALQHSKTPRTLTAWTLSHSGRGDLARTAALQRCEDRGVVDEDVEACRRRCSVSCDHGARRPPGSVTSALTTIASPPPPRRSAAARPRIGDSRAMQTARPPAPRASAYSRADALSSARDDCDLALQDGRTTFSPAFRSTQRLFYILADAMPCLSNVDRVAALVERRGRGRDVQFGRRAPAPAGRAAPVHAS